MKNSNKSGLVDVINRQRKNDRNPIISSVDSGIFKAITTGVPDPEGRGRLSAYVPKLGGTPDTPMYFQYASPFGGSNGSSGYGFFAVPPDKGLTVMVFFADHGDLTEGYWFSVVQPVPNVASGGAAGAPKVDGTGQGEGAFSDVESSKASVTTLSQAQDPDNAVFYDEFGDPIPKEETTAGQGETSGSTVPNSDRNANLAGQGTYTDPLRGQSSSSPMRDASYNEPGHSRVAGMVTPGQNAITFDDGSVGDDGTIHPSQIRLTTGNGAAVVIDGTNDFVYLINSAGTSWVELGADGNISVFGSGSISMRAEKDINFRADQNFNIEAGGRVNIRSGSHFTAESQGHSTIISKGSQFFDSKGSTHLKVGSNMYASTGGLMHLNGPQAAMGQGIPTASMPDIQNLESTQTRDIIGSSMPSHEPYMRPSPANTGGGAIVPDSSSYAAQAEAINAEAKSYSGENVSGQTVATGSGEGGNVTYGSIGTRRMPLQPQLLNMIKNAAQQCKLDVVITSAGQALKGSSGPRTGSTRHDLGYAADIALYDNGKILSVARSADLPLIITFCRTIKGMGIMSIGAGPGYMNSTAIHVDIAPGNNLTPSGAGRY